MNMQGLPILISCLPLLWLACLKAAEVPRELSELESLPELAIKRIGRMLPDEDLAHLVRASKRFKNILSQKLAKRGELINYWARPDIQSRILEKQYAASLAFCPDGNVIAFGCEFDPLVRLWNIHDGEHIKQLVGHGELGRARNVAFSPDGQTLFSRSSDGPIIVWDLKTGKSIREIASEIVEWRPLELLPDNSLLATPFLDAQTVYQWNTLAKWLRKKWLRSSTWLLLLLEWLPAKMFAAASLDSRTVDLWKGLPDIVKKNLMVDGFDLASIMFSPNGKHVATVSFSCEICLWDTVTGEHKRLLKSGPPYLRLAATFSPDSRLVAAGPFGYDEKGCQDNNIRIWRAGTGKLLQLVRLPITEIPYGYNGFTNKVLFSPDGKPLAFGCYNGDIFLLTVADPQK